MFELFAGEVFVGFSCLFLTIALALGWGKQRWKFFCGLCGTICLFSAGFNVFGIKVISLQGLESMLDFDPLFTLVRVALCVTAFVVILVSFHTEKIEDSRKPEQCLFVIFQLLFSLVLISSIHLLISYV